MKAAHVVLSHAHLDHIGGIFGHARAHGMVCSGSTPTYYVPEELVPKLEEARSIFSDMDAACRSDVKSQTQKREKGLLNMNIIPVRAGEEIEIQQKKVQNGTRYYLRPFEVSHCGHPAYGYNLVSKVTRRKLKEEYKGIGGKELGRLVKSGVEIHIVETIERVEALYTGDTNVDGLLFSKNDEKSIQCRKYLQQGFTAPLVMCELTYLLESEKELAKERGHMNIYDIEPILNSHKNSSEQSKGQEQGYTNQKLVFYHLSTRGKNAEHILQSMANVLPNEVALRCEVALASFPASTSSHLMKDNGCVSVADYMDLLQQKDHLAP